MEKYQLFIGRYKELPYEEYTYYTPISGYMLVYTKNSIEDKGFKKVIPEKEVGLKQEEKTWLAATKLTIVSKDASVSMQELTESMNRFMDLLEKVMKENAEKTKKED